jgi:2-oxoisovalerate dehydrogenase E2 component (dihydrolipoyl transacylase)
VVRQGKKQHAPPAVACSLAGRCEQYDDCFTSHTTRCFHLQEGDVIRAFDRVCEVQSDKATVEITSRFGGVVAKVYSAEGDVVKVRSITRWDRYACLVYAS